MPKKAKSKPKPTLGQQIRAAREKAGLTQADLAYEVKASTGHHANIGKIERAGEHARSAEIIDTIRRVLAME